MKALALAALAAAVLVSPVTTGAAQAAPNPTGTLCGFLAVNTPQVAGGFTGVIVGGPLAFPDDTDLTLAHTATLVCTIQTGANDTHAEPDEVMERGSRSRASSVATNVNYYAGESEDLWLCSHVEFSNRSPLYWDDSAGDWSASSSVSCALAISAEIPDPGPVGGELDPILCPILSLVFPPEGDVRLPAVGWVKDCPPYDDGRLQFDGVVNFVLPEATEPR